MTRKEWKRVIKLGLIFGTPLFVGALILGVLWVIWPVGAGIITILLLLIATIFVIGSAVDILAGEHFLE